MVLQSNNRLLAFYTAYEEMQIVFVFDRLLPIQARFLADSSDWSMSAFGRFLPVAVLLSPQRHGSYGLPPKDRVKRWRHVN